MTELINLFNIGDEMERKQKSIGVTSKEELVQEGSKSVFLKPKSQYPNVYLVHLYCLEGAIELVNDTCLSDEVKQDLKFFSDEVNER